MVTSAFAANGAGTDEFVEEPQPAIKTSDVASKVRMSNMTDPHGLMVLRAIDSMGRELRTRPAGGWQITTGQTNVGLSPTADEPKA
jgi:hypothetical protein